MNIAHSKIQNHEVEAALAHVIYGIRSSGYSLGLEMKWFERPFD